MSVDLALDGLAARIAEHVQRRLGIAVSGSATEILGGEFAAIRFDDLPRPNGFSLVLTNSSKAVIVETVFDRFSRSLIENLGNFEEEDLANWKSICTSVQDTGSTLTIVVNGNVVDPYAMNSSEIWESFSIESQIKLRPGLSRIDAAIACATGVATLLFTLVTVEELDSEEFTDDFELPTLGEEEGRKLRVSINRYERSRKNRATCLSIYGPTCFSCGLNFDEFYGNLGTGYIEVHHRNPVSLMGGSYRLDPKKDLVPLCANCHRMVHRQWPPVTPENLKEIVISQKNECEKKLPNGEI